MIPGVKGSLVYYISHNITRKELLPDGHGGFKGEGWVHRKARRVRFRRVIRRCKTRCSPRPVIRSCSRAIRRRAAPSWSPIRRAWRLTR